MPLVYRTMRKDEDDRPTVGQVFCTLAARFVEIDLDAQDNAIPSDKGISVAPHWRMLPFVVLPRRLHPRGRCTIPVHCFRRGTGDFKQEACGTNLELLPDRSDDGVVRHGVIRPAQAIPVAEHQQNLAATREEWEIDEKP